MRHRLLSWLVLLSLLLSYVPVAVAGEHSAGVGPPFSWVVWGSVTVRGERVPGAQVAFERNGQSVAGETGPPCEGCVDEGYPYYGIDIASLITDVTGTGVITTSFTITVTAAYTDTTPRTEMREVYLYEFNSGGEMRLDITLMGEATEDGAWSDEFDDESKLAEKVGVDVQDGRLLLPTETLTTTLNWKAAYVSERMGHGMTYDSRRGRVVLFGGASTNSTEDALNDTWEYDGTGWMQVATPSSPPPNTDTHLTYNSQRGRVILFGGYNSDGEFRETWEYDGTTWVQISTATTPSARGRPVYDSCRGVTVMFVASVQETWEYDGTDWTRIPTAAAPSAGGAVAFDSTRCKIVMFAGSTSETWEYDGSNWSKIDTAATPSAMGRMVYDSVRGRTVMFGGESGGSLYDDTWEYDGSNWTLASTATSPQPRNPYGMAYDSARGKTVLFGGWCGHQDGGCKYADTWEYDGTDWVLAVGVTYPFKRGAYGMAYDSIRGKTVIFGGYRDGVGYTDETWEYDGVWTKESPSGSPSARDAVVMTYDSGRDRIVLFGGHLTPNSLDDTWEYHDGTTWSQISTTTVPPARKGQGMAYDSRRGRVVMFGGVTSPGPPDRNLNDTWEYDGTDWVQINPTTSPPAPGYAPMVYDSCRGVTVMFVSSTRETWEYDGTDWTLRSTAAAPSASGAMAFDSARCKVVMFVGSARETWEYDGTNWVQVSTRISPPARSNAAMAYDSAQGKVILYGGNGGGSDTWEYGLMYTGPGTATSSPITLPSGAANWNTLELTSTVPASTTLTVDVLDTAGIPITTVVAVDGPMTRTLSFVDSLTHGTIKLRANLTTADSTVSPELDAWAVTWTGADSDVTYAVAGYVTDGLLHPLEDVNVALYKNDELTASAQTTTGKEGHRKGDYTITGLRPTISDTYKIRVTLRNGTAITPTFQVRYAAHDRYNGPLVHMETTVSFDTSSMFTTAVRDFDFSCYQNASGNPCTYETNVDEQDKGNLTSMAVIYYHIQQAMDFISDGLGETLDLIPLNVNVYADTGGVFYEESQSAIVIGIPSSDYPNGDRPMNREWHESFHHLMTDTIGIPPLAPGDVNHGGYTNSMTSDSWSEGYAEFWSCVLWEYVGYPDPYPCLYKVGKGKYPSPVNMEINWHVRDYYYPGARSLEEYAVASLLWDLYDPISGPDGDFVQVTRDQIWGVIGSVSPGNNLSDMKDVYDAFVAAGIGSGDSNFNGVSDLDDIFVNHGVFYDVNLNRLYEPDLGEVVGIASDPNRPNRRNTPSDPKAYLLVDLAQVPLDNTVQASNALTPTELSLTVVVDFQPPYDYYDYDYAVDLEDFRNNSVYLEPPPSRLPARVQLFARQDDLRTEIYAIDNATYWDAVAGSPGGPVEEVTLTFPSCVLRGDVDASGSVDTVDIMQVANYWHTTVPDPLNTIYDLDGDGVITVIDIQQVAAQWDTMCGAPNPTS